MIDLSGTVFSTRLISFYTYMQTYLRLEEIKLSLHDDEKILSDKIQKILGIKKEDLISYTIVKKSIDSRDK